MEQADSCQRGVGRRGRKGKGLAKNHASITQSHREQCGDGLSEGEQGWEEQPKEGARVVHIYNSVNNKNKE